VRQEIFIKKVPELDRLCCSICGLYEHICAGGAERDVRRTWSGIGGGEVKRGVDNVFLCGVTRSLIIHVGRVIKRKFIAVNSGI
jgi:hypothetical protein